MASLVYGASVRPGQHETLFEKQNLPHGCFEGRCENFSLQLRIAHTFGVRSPSSIFFLSVTNMDKDSCKHVSR